MKEQDLLKKWEAFLKKCMDFFIDEPEVVFDNITNLTKSMTEFLNEYYLDNRHQREGFEEEKKILEELIEEAKQFGEIKSASRPIYEDEGIDKYVALFYKFNDYNIYMRLLGVYDSYEGLTHYYATGGNDEWLNNPIGNWKIVKPIEKTITVYE